jgi:hypothetical protein
MVMAVLTGFSIGVAVVIPAAIAVVGTVMTISTSGDRRTVVAALGGAVVGVAVVLIGLQLAWQVVSCPATGESGGTLPGFIGQGATYDCSNGVLTVTR